MFEANIVILFWINYTLTSAIQTSDWFRIYLYKMDILEKIPNGNYSIEKIGYNIST